jgi:hypothetical protein
VIVSVTQRWRSGRASYRPAGEPIRTADYDVELLRGARATKAFIAAHHYERTMPATRFRVGLLRRGELVGVAVFSVPPNPRTLDVLPAGRDGGVLLGRLVLLDDVPANGESFLVGRAFELVRRQGVTGVVSFSDPTPRYALDGRMVKRGHLGVVYMATNGCYRGLTRKGRMRILPDGTVFHNRAAAKIRKRDKGWRYAAAFLERYGATPLGEFRNARAWLDRWLPRLTRSVPHCGNHTYLWNFDRAARRRMPPSLPYPKLDLGGSR